MKKYIKLLFSFIMMAILITAVSCDDDDGVADGSGTGNVSISSVTPDPQFQDKEVTLEGTGFDEVQFIFVGDKQAQFTLVGNTLTFIVPINATVETNAIVTLAMLENYRVTTTMEVLLRPVPVIERFTPYVAIGGDLVMSGTGFNIDYDLSVTIGDVPATITSQTNTDLTVTVPGGIPDDEALTIAITSIHGVGETNTAFIARDGLVENSDLYDGEGDDFTNWEKKNGGDGMTQITGEEAYGGGRSMRVVAPGTDAWRTQFGSSFTILTEGEEYTVIVYAKGEESGGEMRVSVSEWNNSNGDDFFYGDFVELSTTWEAYTWTFVAGTTVNGDARLVLDMGSSQVPLLVDHMTIVAGALGVGGEKPNLLANPGFEDGETGWELANGDLSLTSDDAYCGDNSIKAVGDGAGDGWRTQLIADGVELTEGIDYEITLWAKAEGVEGNISVSVSRYLDGNGDDYFYSSTVEVTEDWAPYSWIFTAGTTSNGVHNVVLDLGRDAQTYYIDEVSIREYVEPVNLLVNGDFEDGETGWELANGDLSLTTDEANSGTSSIKAVGDGAGDGWRTQLIADGVELTEGTRYKVTLMAKAESADPEGNISISVSRYLDGNGDDYFYSGTEEVAEDWTQYSWTFIAGTTSNGVHNIVLDLGRDAQTYYIDDVVLSEFSDPCD